MSWIRVLEYLDADDNLKRLYDRVKGPNGKVDNVLKIHSLRPHTLKGHMALYKNVLHNNNNTLPKWYLEYIGVYVSHLNKCSYCVDHHSVGLGKLIDDADRFGKLLKAIHNGEFSDVLDPAFEKGMNYAHDLTLTSFGIKREDLNLMREAGLDDGQILEINQVASYFNYVNRMVLGLGVNTEGDTLGLSPKNSDEGDWSHG